MANSSRICNIDHSPRDPDGLGEDEQRAAELQRSDHFNVFVQNTHSAHNPSRTSHHGAKKVYVDIEWKKNDENCMSNVESVKKYSKMFLPGH